MLSCSVCFYSPVHFIPHRFAFQSSDPNGLLYSLHKPNKYQERNEIWHFGVVCMVGRKLLVELALAERDSKNAGVSFLLFPFCCVCDLNCRPDVLSGDRGNWG